jgi:dTDP-4-amino-4,6-dideoxygalactose transaminase
MMENRYRIPFNRPDLAGREMEYVRQAIERGHLSGGGPFTERCEELLCDDLDAPAALLTSSGTHALEMSALLLGIGPGDEVVVPSYTFVSTASAFALRGASLVFCDVREDTLNIDETRLEGLMTPRTKVIVPVHYAGIGCEMDQIMEMAARHGADVVEDNAHGLFGGYKGRHLGTFGRMSILSFHETKNVTCGEGGALLLNDTELLTRAEILRDKGTDRKRFFRGEVDKYTWVDVGSSYVLSDMLAAFLLAQLQERQRIQARRKALWDKYYRGLSDWASKTGARLPTVPESCDQSYHMFYVLAPSEGFRGRIIRRLRERGILAVFHYQPLHLSAMGRRYGEFDCPVAESVSRRVVRLPMFCSLSDSEQSEVIETVSSIG